MFRSVFAGVSLVAVTLFAGPAWVSAVGAMTLVRAVPGHLVSGQMPAGAVHPSSGTILGSVWNARNEGLPGARVRLRNLDTGRIEATVRADAKGQFTFDGLEGGSYVLELVDDHGRVLALGNNFAVLPGETVATFIRLGAKAPWFADFFGNVAAGAVATAASLGVTALAPVGQAMSPEK